MGGHGGGASGAGARRPHPWPTTVHTTADMHATRSASARGVAPAVGRRGHGAHTGVQGGAVAPLWVPVPLPTPRPDAAGAIPVAVPVRVWPHVLGLDVKVHEVCQGWCAREHVPRGLIHVLLPLDGRNVLPQQIRHTGHLGQPVDAARGPRTKAQHNTGRDQSRMESSRDRSRVEKRETGRCDSVPLGAQTLRNQRGLQGPPQP